MNVSSWSIRNPIPAVLGFVMLTFLGVMAFKAMKIQMFPDIDLPMVTVTASMPGASPDQMEAEVARKIENALASAQGLKHLYTQVKDGTAIVSAEFRLERDSREALEDVRSTVTRIRSDLPKEMLDPVINKVELSGKPIVTYTIADPEHERGGVVLVRGQQHHQAAARRERCRGGQSRRRRDAADSRGARSDQAAGVEYHGH